MFKVATTAILRYFKNKYCIGEKVRVSLYMCRGRGTQMREKKNEIDTGIEPHLRPRPAYWPDDLYCRGYYSSVIPKYWSVDNSYENKISDAAKHLLHENTTLLQEQYHEVSPVFSETSHDNRRARRVAKADIRDFNKQGKLDRRDAAIDAGDCSADYAGRCRDLCYGRGTGGECFRCAGQVVKLNDSNTPAAKHTASGGARQARQRGGD